jgi:hypothetical protein
MYFSDYRPSYQSEGWFHSASFRVHARENVLKELYANGLGRMVEVWGYGLKQHFEGRVVEVVFNLPPDQFTKTLDQIGNRTFMRADVDGDGAVDRSTVLQNTDSQGKYGTTDLVISGGQIEGLSVADQAVQAFLDLKAFPKPAADLGGGRGQAYIELFCRGWIQTLGNRVWNQTADTGTQAMSAEIRDIIGTPAVPAHPYLPEATLLPGMIAWWPLDEHSGTSVHSEIPGGGNGVRGLGNHVLNPGFETAGGGGADVFGGLWGETAGDGAIADETQHIHGGSHAAKLTAGPTKNTEISYFTFGVTPGASYRLGFYTAAFNPDFYDNFTRADGPLGDAPTGETWAITGVGYLEAKIASNRFTTNAVPISNNTAYAYVTLASAPTELRGTFSFAAGPGAATNAVVALISSADATLTLDHMLHLYIGPALTAITIWEPGLPNQTPQSGTYTVAFDPPLATDGSPLSVRMIIDGTHAVVYLPDGQILDITDSRIPSVAGALSCWELISDETSLYVPRWDDVAACRSLAANTGRWYLYDTDNGAYIRATAPAGVLGSAYQEEVYTFVAPAGCSNIGFDVKCPDVDGGIAYFDDVSVDGPLPTMAVAGIGDGRSAFYFDGGDYVNIYSPYLAAAWNGDKYSVGLWCNIIDAAVWADATVRTFLRIGSLAGTADQLQLRKSATANTLSILHRTNGTSYQVDDSSLGATLDPFLIGLTVDLAADEVKAYLNGVQVGATLTGFSAWSGALDSTICVLGASTTASAAPHIGRLQHPLVFSRRVLTAAEWLAIYAGGDGVVAAVAASGVGQFIASQHRAPNTTSVTKELDADRKALDIINNMTSLGDADNNRYLLQGRGRTPTSVKGRRAVFKQAAPVVVPPSI